MTSPLRKKPRTTPPNTPATGRKRSASRDAAGSATPLDVVVGGAAAPLPSAPLPYAARPLRVEPTWLPAGMLATVMLLTTTAGALGADNALQWRAAGSKAKPTPTRVTANRVIGTPAPGRVSAARWIDPQVRAVAYDEPAVRVAQGQDNGNDPLFGDELLKEFSRPMVREADEQKPRTFEELPSQDLPTPSTDTPGFDAPDFDAPRAPEPPIIEPPLIDSDADRSPARPRVDPFDDPASPGVENLAPAPPTGAGSGTRGSAPLRPRSDDYDRQRSEALESCAEELAKLRAGRLSAVDLEIAQSGVEGEDFPFVCSIDDGIPLAPRCWEPITYTWKASGLCHKPLYFEQEQLERYGHSWGPVMQPLVSGAHFFGHLMVLPYSMGLKAPNECVYALGHYRPGSCAPYMIPAVPFTWRAAAFQTGFATGTAFLVP